jgi:hypothetical protein
MDLFNEQLVEAGVVLGRVRPHVEDDVLRLITACHPVLSVERAAELTSNEAERAHLLARASSP